MTAKEHELLQSELAEYDESRRPENRPMSAAEVTKEILHSLGRETAKVDKRTEPRQSYGLLLAGLNL